MPGDLSGDLPGDLVCLVSRIDRRGIAMSTICEFWTRAGDYTLSVSELYFYDILEFVTGQPITHSLQIEQHTHTLPTLTLASTNTHIHATLPMPGRVWFTSDHQKCVAINHKYAMCCSDCSDCGVRSEMLSPTGPDLQFGYTKIQFWTVAFRTFSSACPSSASPRRQACRKYVADPLLFSASSAI